MDLEDHGELPWQPHDVVPGAVDGHTTSPTGRVLCELDNPMRDPGDGTIISATNISILHLRGRRLVELRPGGRSSNPLRFVSAAMKWCKKRARNSAR